ncbi:MAG: Bifunctional protein FolD [Pseudomonadota bacterium]|nr:Bifunctional protein FolD [Pseudomonadota bacterium]
MTAEILSSIALAQQIQNHIALEICQLPGQPVLKVILVGDNPASQIYVQRKKNACQKVGILCDIEEHPLTISEAALINILQQHGKNPNIHGILVQFPLPQHINPSQIIEHIPPEKDVDGFHPYNLGRLASASPFLRPCTPFGIIQLLEHYKIDLQGMDTIILGTSRIVGRPMALELLIKKATVTLCHTKTKNLEKKIEDNQLIIVATGNQNIIDANRLHSEHIIIDVGIHRTTDGKIRGDIDFEIARTKVKAVSPVPGGVGPMTISTLLQNLIQAYKYQHHLS